MRTKMHCHPILFASLFFFLSAFFFLGCGSQPERPKLPDISQAKVQALVDGNNRFAFKLFNQLSKRKNNVFISPYSISIALAMTYAGANGQTKDEMRKALQFPNDDKQLHTAFEWLIKTIQYQGAKGAYQLSLANRLWPQKGYPFLPAFLQLEKDHYGSDMLALDYKTQTEESRKTINKWVEEQTQNKIKELLKPGMIKRLTRLVLTNAIYFKGNWKYQFDSKKTTSQEFTTASGSKVSVKMMSQKETFDYGNTSDGVWQVIRLPYKGKEISMILMLPSKQGTLLKQEGSLSSEYVDKALRSLKATKVLVQIPKWKMEYEAILNQQLKELGMSLAFEQTADFSKMDGVRELYVGVVAHKAFLEVNEEGSEAAAATAVVMNTKAAIEPTPTFRADHPFILLIRDEVTKTILFMGRVLDPSK